MLLAFLSSIHRAFKILLIAFGFISFGVGGLFLSHIVYVLLHVCIWKKAKRKHAFRWVIGHTFRLFLWYLTICRLIKVQTVGFDQLSQDQGALWLCNHPSLIDYVIVCALVPNLNCMVKGSLWRNKFLGATIRAAEYIPNDASDALEQCQRSLAQGENILIFPEGTRTPTVQNQPLTLKRGAANIALRCQANVRFFHITQEPRFLTKEQKWYYVPPRTSCYTVTVGEYWPYAQFSCNDPELLPRKVRDLTDVFAQKLAQDN